MSATTNADLTAPNSPGQTATDGIDGAVDSTRNIRDFFDAIQWRPSFVTTGCNS